MSTPITASAFAAALPPLPLSTLRLKVAELRNSLAYLLLSNAELQPYAQSGDKDCADAIGENKEVISRMEERVELLRQEVERRGVRWEEGEFGVGVRELGEDAVDGEKGVEDRVNGGKEDVAGQVNGEVSERTERMGLNGDGAGHAREVREGGRQGLSDEELARRLREQMAEEEGMEL